MNQDSEQNNAGGQEPRRDGERRSFGRRDDDSKDKYADRRPRTDDAPRFNRASGDSNERPRFSRDDSDRKSSSRDNSDRRPRNDSQPRFSRDSNNRDDKPRFNRDDKPRFERGGSRDGDRPSFNRPARDNDRPANSGDRRPRFDNDRPTFNRDRNDGDRPRFNRDNNSRDDKPRFDRDRPERPAFNRASRDDKPRFSRDNRSNDGRRSGDGDADSRPRFNRDNNNRDEKPRFNRDDKPRFERGGSRDGDRPTFNRPTRDTDRPANSGDRRPRFDNDRPSFNRDRPANSGDRPRFNRDSNTRDDKPRFDRDRPERPAFNRTNRDDKPRFDRDNRAGDRNDRPRFNQDDKPRFDRSDRDDKPGFKRVGGFNRDADERNRFGRDDQRDTNRSDAPKRDGEDIPSRFSSEQRKESGDRRTGRYEKAPNYDLKPTRNDRFDKPRKPRQSDESDRPNRSSDTTRSRNDSDPSQMRLNRYIANSGVCSRREADELIERGDISVNGKVVTEMGFKVKDGDTVKYGTKVLNPERFVYVLLNKPKDYITTTEDPEERKTVMELVADAGNFRMYPVGRLDRNTTGLLLLTNDGELADKLTHPSHEIRKIYQVEIDKPITNEHFEAIQKGVTLEDGPIKPDAISIITPDAHVVGIEIHSGRNRIVRRMFEHLGYEVTKLDRTTYAGLTKKDLPRGKWRFLDPKEVVKLKYFN